MLQKCTVISPKEHPQEVKVFNFQKAEIHLPCEVTLKDARTNQFVENDATPQVY
jgi:hypothetical protein